MYIHVKSLQLISLIGMTGLISCFGHDIDHPLKPTSTHNTHDYSNEVIYRTTDNCMHMPNGEQLKIINSKTNINASDLSYNKCKPLKEY